MVYSNSLNGQLHTQLIWDLGQIKGHVLQPSCPSFMHIVKFMGLMIMQDDSGTVTFLNMVKLK